MRNSCIESEPVVTALAAERVSQVMWAAAPLGKRLKIVRNLRHQLARHADALASAAAEVSQRPVAEKLVSEVLPLADACRWLERRAASVLSARRCGSRGRPLWMRGTSFEVRRQPFGIVL